MKHFNLDEKTNIISNRLIFYDLETARDIAEHIDQFDFDDLKDLIEAISIIARGKSESVKSNP